MTCFNISEEFEEGILKFIWDLSSDQLFFVKFGKLLHTLEDNYLDTTIQIINLEIQTFQIESAWVNLEGDFWVFAKNKHLSQMRTFAWYISEV